MSRQQPHLDVAAYALGILEPSDAFRFEEHLAGCAACAVGLSGLTALAGALSELAGPRRIDARPGPELLERLTGAVVAQRGLARRRRLVLGAVAASLIVALPTAVLLVRGTGEPAPPRVVASDPATGVTASVALEDRGWGTAVALRLTGLAGPRICRLVAVGNDGVEHPVLSWRVPEGGYGVRERPGGAGPLHLEAGTELHTAEIGRWEVRAESGERLLSIGG